jgi:hypothetical protein
MKDYPEKKPSHFETMGVNFPFVGAFSKRSPQ